MGVSRATRGLAWIGIPVLLIAALVAFWNWDWFIPLVEARASAAAGRKVTIEHLHVGLGPIVTVSADGVRLDNPPGWPSADPPLATVRRLTIEADVLGWIEGHGLVLPLIGLDAPQVYATETTSDNANFRLSPAGGSGTTVRIGDLRINDGLVRAVMPPLKADFTARVATEGKGNDASIVVQADGRYAGQPITGKLVGGALLSLRDKAHPWPVDLTIANGPTHIALKGTLQDPLALAGADVTLQLSGPDMAQLEPLAGFAIPKTPAYEFAGKLDLHGLDNISFRDIHGRLGSSDIAGSITQKPGTAEAGGKSRPDVVMDLHSTRVNLADLSGFIGGTPAGGGNTRNATPEERKEAAAASKSRTLLPNKPIPVPRLSWADIHLHYHGAHIEGRNMPLDNVTVVLDGVNGHIQIHPVSFGVGAGRLESDIDLVPLNDRSVRTRADIRLQNLDVSRLMAATHTFQGAGSISGVGAIESTGDSFASLLGNGNGEVKMAMAGGELSALLVDLTGLQFGNALLSALGVPQKTPVQCFVSALALRQGLLEFKAMTLDTGAAITNVTGALDLKRESIDLHLKTDSKHFSIGSLPTNINITGTFKNPSIRPGAAAAARAGAVAGLGVLFAPLAILPTIQFGTSQAEDQRCGRLLQQARSESGGKVLPVPDQGASAR